MGVINMAHGEFMILGAYVTYLTATTFENISAESVQRGTSFWHDIGVHRLRFAGMLVEWALIRHLYKRPLDTPARDLGAKPDPAAGLSLDLRRARSRRRTAAMDARVEAGHDTIEVPINGIFVMCLTVLITLAVAYIMYKSRWAGRSAR